MPWWGCGRQTPATSLNVEGCIRHAHACIKRECNCIKLKAQLFPANCFVTPTTGLVAHACSAKSSVAAAAACALNPALNVRALQNRVSPDTETVFDDAFWVRPPTPGRGSQVCDAYLPSTLEQ